MSGHRSAPLLVPFLIASLLGACGKHDDTAGDEATASTTGSDVALPKPQATGGSVTGMPAKPGPNPVGPVPAPGDETVASADRDLMVDASDAGDTTGASVDETTAGDEAAAAGDATVVTTEPSQQDAVAVLHAYYAAINQRDFQRAWSNWSDGGHSSGQTPQQFADGFANTAQVTLRAGAPGAVGAAAGSRYVEIPVTLDATQRDGSVHHYVGTYTLRRAVVDGATDAQRAWHIESATLHESTQ